ncbi:uncharacterized protein PAN0_019d5762 [Moesziomyces antarcticus]|uniref:Uncharacterized protein n=2 Tax=Pseudozyma antarctica TaxID=84753 RepID=A0A5C3FZ40_PSEA2|nr:uncharacterized protein PAN0_019d5762 [Moesziomyces antarcticus]GAK67534.1 hypothetical protein PAN0_019d5762 [Moesziomyces antarcticus]SPO48799.1 uncharacterized protein PSANT_06490 [Moesziomyces antarcticus]
MRRRAASRHLSRVELASRASAQAVQRASVLEFGEWKIAYRRDGLAGTRMCCAASAQKDNSTTRRRSSRASQMTAGRSVRNPCISSIPHLASVGLSLRAVGHALPTLLLLLISAVGGVQSATNAGARRVGCFRNASARFRTLDGEGEKTGNA